VVNLREERTVVLIKPDGVQRGLIGEIISRIERCGLKVIALEMFWATKEQMDNHYPKDKKWIERLGTKTLATYKKYKLNAKKELGTEKEAEIGKMVRSWLISYMISAPLVKMVIKGVHAVGMVRKMAGNTMPALAEMGTIRGDFSVDSAAAANREKRSVHNIVHASETPEEAEHEIEHWFAPEEIHDYERKGEI
jgi:nucleoside-diphosphate kinase